MSDHPQLPPFPPRPVRHDPALAEAWDAGHAAGRAKRRGVPWLVAVIAAPLLMLGSCGVGSAIIVSGDPATYAASAPSTVEVPGPTVTADPEPAVTVTAKPAPARTVTAKAEPAPTVTVTATTEVEVPAEPAPTVTVTERAPATDADAATEPEADLEPESMSGGGGSVYYENCTAVRAAGADPIFVGDPGYASHLDRDGDGVGCE